MKHSGAAFHNNVIKWSMKSAVPCAMFLGNGRIHAVVLVIFITVTYDGHQGFTLAASVR